MAVTSRSFLLFSMMDLSIILPILPNPFMPIFMLIIFYTISMSFHQKERLFLITGCLIGMIIHLLLDLFQINLGGGYYMPFFPLSFHRVTFGLYETEASIFWLPVTILLTITAIILKNFLGYKRKMTSRLVRCFLSHSTQLFRTYGIQWYKN